MRTRSSGAGRCASLLAVVLFTGCEEPEPDDGCGPPTAILDPDPDACWYRLSCAETYDVVCGAGACTCEENDVEIATCDAPPWCGETVTSDVVAEFAAECCDRDISVPEEG